jgi:hypothetical protein
LADVEGRLGEEVRGVFVGLRDMYDK